MSRKRHTPEQIVHKLRKAEVEFGKGATPAEACCEKIGVTKQTLYRWHAERLAFGRTKRSASRSSKKRMLA